MALRRQYEGNLPPSGIPMSEEDFERLILELAVDDIYEGILRLL